MAPQIRVDNGNFSEATTWVCKAPGCNLPYFGDALDDALQKGTQIGLHADSGSIVVVFSEPQPIHRAQSKLQVIFGNGGATRCVKGMEAFDLFHAESWGLVTFHAPQMPEYIDTIIEEDEDSESEDKLDIEPENDAVGSEPSSSTALEVPAQELAMPAANIFALVQKPKTIRVPDPADALDMETSYQKDLREAMEKAGGPLSEDLKKALFPRGMQHAKEVQDEIRALAKKKSTDAIFWVTDPPEFLTVYGKPNMSMPRRIEWIKWRANKLNLELTNPMFMAIFKQVTFYSGPEARKKQFWAALKSWKKLDWMSLPDDERLLILNINEGNNDCYCKNCNRVLDTKATTKFCSSSCKSYFCRCGTKFEVKMVTDYEKLGILQKRVGPYDELVKLARMLEHKAEVVKYQNASDVNPKFDELIQKRQAEKCCEAVDGCMDKRWCKRCLDEFQGINFLKNCVWDIRSGKVTWGHCEEATRRLKTLAEIPNPQMEDKNCNAEACKSARKKARTF